MGLTILLVIAVFVLAAAAIFTVGASDKTKKTVPEQLVSFKDTYYWLECNDLCAHKLDRYDCDESPEGTDLTCAEIFELKDEAFRSMSGDPEDPQGGTVGHIKTKSYSLSGDFMPCSTMKVTFHEDIKSLSEFGAKIAQEGASEKLKLEQGHNLGNPDTGILWICGDEIDEKCGDIKDENGRLEAKIKLPCTSKTGVAQFKAGTKYVFTFESKDAEGPDPKLNLKEFERELVCLDWASFPDGISFNQQASTPPDQLRRTKVKFKKEIVHPDVGKMEADVILVNGLAGPTDLNIENGLLRDKSDPDNPYYYFRMRPVKDTLEEIRFQIKLHDKVICTANVDKGVDVSCQNTLPYHCYKDSTGSVHILQDGPFEKDEAAGATLTPDGLCFYKEEHVCRDGCMRGDTFTPGLPDNCPAGSNERYANTCFKEDKPSKCSYVDLLVLKPVTCKGDVCGEPLFEGDSSSGYAIRQTVENIGDKSIQYNLKLNQLTSTSSTTFEMLRVLDDEGKPFEVRDADDKVLYTLDGGDKPLKDLPGVKDVWDEGIFIPVYKIKAEHMNKEIKIDYLPGELTDRNHRFVKGEYTLTAMIGNPDTMLVPLIAEGAREKNNKATNEIKVYDKNCKTCNYDNEAECESECDKICEWETDAIEGVKKCQKID